MLPQEELIITELQLQLNSMLYLPMYCLQPSEIKKEDLRSLYSNLSDSEFKGLDVQSALCYESCVRFCKFLKSAGFMHRHLFILFNNIPTDDIKLHGFNKEYCKIVKQGNYSELLALFQQYNIETTNVIGGHSIIEVKIGNRFQVVDPYNGFLYANSKEDLLRNPSKTYEGLQYLEQVNYITNSIHQNRATLLYATAMLWENVHHICPASSIYEIEI